MGFILVATLTVGTGGVKDKFDLPFIGPPELGLAPVATDQETTGNAFDIQNELVTTQFESAPVIGRAAALVITTGEIAAAVENMEGVVFFLRGFVTMDTAGRDPDAMTPRC